MTIVTVDPVLRGATWDVAITRVTSVAEVRGSGASLVFATEGNYPETSMNTMLHARAGTPAQNSAGSAMRLAGPGQLHPAVKHRTCLREPARHPQ